MTSLAQLEEVRQVQAETKRIYSIYYSEYFAVRCVCEPRSWCGPAVERWPKPGSLVW
jgi:hypothetical protein